jgi:hypothetical protein
MQLYMLLRLWWMRRRQALALAGRISENFREVGDNEYGYYSRFLTLAYSGLAGESVAEIENQLRELADAVRRSGQRYPEPERCHLVYRFLLGGDDAELERELVESDAWIAANSGSAEVYIRTFWMLILCVRGRFEAAIAQSDQVWSRLFQVVPYVHVTDHTLLRGLASAALATEASGAARRRHLGEIAACLTRLRRWAKHGPDFGHMATLLEAEQARLRGDANRARALYDKATHAAKEAEHLHHAALACERRGRMLATLRRETEAGAALRDAIALYARWGATPKAEALEQERRALVGS